MESGEAPYRGLITEQPSSLTPTPATQRPRRPFQVTPTTPLSPPGHIYSKRPITQPRRLQPVSLLYMFSIFIISLDRKLLVLLESLTFYLSSQRQTETRQYPELSRCSSYIVELRPGYAVTPTKERTISRSHSMRYDRFYEVTCPGHEPWGGRRGCYREYSSSYRQSACEIFGRMDDVTRAVTERRRCASYHCQDKIRDVPFDNGSATEQWHRL